MKNDKSNPKESSLVRGHKRTRFSISYYDLVVGLPHVCVYGVLKRLGNLTEIGRVGCFRNFGPGADTSSNIGGGASLLF